MVKPPFLESVRLTERAQTIVQQLRLKYPDQVPAELSNQIEQTQDRAHLEQMTAAVLVAPSLDDFRRDCGL